MATRREEMAATREKADADWRAWREKMDASHKETVAELEPKNDEETLACREVTEARPEEKMPTSVDKKSEVAQKGKVSIENAGVMPVGEPRKKRRKDRKLAAEHRRPMKGRTVSE
jgi:hypothetical protein